MEASGTTEGIFAMFSNFSQKTIFCCLPATMLSDIWQKVGLLGLTALSIRKNISSIYPPANSSNFWIKKYNFF